MRFGSRVDLWVPQGSELLVKVGDNVSGGSSVLARWPLSCHQILQRSHFRCGGKVILSMPDLDQQEIPFEGRRTRVQARLRRGIFLLPAMMTSANLLCGYYAVVASLLGTPEDFNHAAKAIGIAIVFDSLDGRVARMTGTNTEFGVQFDSLADVVSFGVAPAVLAYAWGVRSVANLAPAGCARLGHFGWLCCLAFLICCAWRLARFNVQGMAPGGSKYFVGMPTPAAAGVIASIVHAFHTRWTALGRRPQ